MISYLKPRLLPKSEVPKLLRGCGRAPSNADLKELLEPFGAWDLEPDPKTYGASSQNLKDDPKNKAQQGTTAL